jgi:hypothetical protein
MKATRAAVAQTSHQNALAELHSRRRALIAEMSSLQSTIDKVESAPKEEADVRAEIGRLDAKEREAAHRWAEQGASGEPPAVDMKARIALNDKLAGAVAKSAANGAAAAALHAKQAGLAQQVNALNQPIAITANNVLVDKLGADVDEAKSLIARLTPLMASIDSGRLVIVNENHRIVDAGGGQGSHELFMRLEAITGTRDMLTTGDPAQNFFSEWLTELDALKQGNL